MNFISNLTGSRDFIENGVGKCDESKQKKNEWIKVGTTIIESRITSQKVSATIEKMIEGNYGRILYHAILGEKVLGVLTIYEIRPNKSCELSYALGLIASNDSLAHYDKENKGQKLSKIYVEWIASIANGLYRGIGTGLMGVAIEHSLNSNCDGRIMLKACNNAHGFYREVIKMSCCSEEINQKIDSELKKAKEEKTRPNTESLGGVWMYLPQTAILQWKETIRKNHVLTEF